MKSFWKDFKAFISRGNILDMAVGVIIGSAFSAIVTAFTNKIIMPLINCLLSYGGDGLDSAYTFLKKVESEVDGNMVVDLEKSIFIDWGAFITAVLNFLIIALTLFVILKVAMKSSQFLHNTTNKLTSSKATKEEKIEMKEKGLNYKEKTVLLNFREEKKKAIEEEKAKLEAEQKEKARLERLENPTQEDLLKEICALLKEQNEKKSK